MFSKNANVSGLWSFFIVRKNRCTVLCNFIYSIKMIEVRTHIIASLVPKAFPSKKWVGQEKAKPDLDDLIKYGARLIQPIFRSVWPAKSGPPQKLDQFFRNFSSWTEPIHWVLDRNFRKFWLNGSRPRTWPSNRLLPGPSCSKGLGSE